MRKPIYFSGTCALFVAVAIFVWSQNAPVFSRTNTASPSLLPSSTEMMSNDSRPLPVEQWDAF